MINYADDHTLLTTIPSKTDRCAAATDFNTNMVALCEYRHPWNIQFAPQKIFSLLISLKSEVCDHSPLFLNNTRIPEVSSIKVLGFLFSSSFTWQKHIDSVLSHGKQRMSQLYRC